MKQFADTNVVLAASRGNELAVAALEQAGVGQTGTLGVQSVALDVAEELFVEFSEEAGIVCEPGDELPEIDLHDESEAFVHDYAEQHAA